MKYHKVKQHEDLLRDPHSKAVVTADHKAYMKHLQDKRLAEEARNANQRVAGVEADINMLKNEMTEIKQLLLQVASQTKVN